MTTDDLMREIREQIATLTAHRRKAVQLRIDRQYLAALYCATGFRPSTWGGPEIATMVNPESVGIIYGLEGVLWGMSVTTQDTHPNEIRVVPSCWEGYGQGQVRPR